MAGAASAANRVLAVASCVSRVLTLDIGAGASVPKPKPITRGWRSSSNAFKAQFGRLKPSGRVDDFYYELDIRWVNVRFHYVVFCFFPSEVSGHIKQGKIVGERGTMQSTVWRAIGKGSRNALKVKRKRYLGWHGVSKHTKVQSVQRSEHRLASGFEAHDRQKSVDLVELAATRSGKPESAHLWIALEPG